MAETSRRVFLTGLAVTAVGCARTQMALKSRRPNVLLIINDQHNPRSMGCAGDPIVKTPSIDRLAAQGVRFPNAYATSPLCAPTRHTLYTGLYPSSHGVFDNGVPMRDVGPTLMQLLNDAGYTTANVGKMHISPVYERLGFQYVLRHEFHMGNPATSHYPAYLDKALAERGMTRGPEWHICREGYLHWGVDPHTLAKTNWVPEDLTPERWTTDQAVVFLRDQLANRPDQPFFLHASYFPPHQPYQPVKRFADMYKPEDMPLPPTFDRKRADDFIKYPGVKKFSNDDYKRLRAFYYGFISQFDAEMGRLLDAVHDLGLADNTIVLFMSDHGDMMGEHGLLYKREMYEGSARIPFMVRWPGGPAGRIESTPVSHIDVVPTILAAAEVTPAYALPGEDLAPYVLGKKSNPSRPVYSELLIRKPFAQLMLRQGVYKLIALGTGEDTPPVYRLFNVETDPWEEHDLIDSPDHAGIFARMKTDLMAQWEMQQSDCQRPQKDRVKPNYVTLHWPADPWKPPC